MIKFVEIRGLNRIANVCAEFHPDINIITGRNGSGKTTVLKIIWYLISGNLERIPREVSFDFARVVSEKSSVQITCSSDNEEFHVEASAGSWSTDFKCKREDVIREAPLIKESNHAIARANSSVFFPTFRRIEGGFTIGTDGYRDVGILSGERLYSGKGQIQDAFDTLSSQFSLYNHRFVCSISTSDIVNLLTRKYADISQKTNEQHSSLVNKIISEIDQSSSNKPSPEAEAKKLLNANRAIDNIKQMTTEYRIRQEDLLSPFSRLSEFIDEIFKEKSISITSSLGLGLSENRILSSMLSAGEKQMLSFLVYNIFHFDTPIFIDEPELSLHVDWQRSMFPRLLQQKTTNQFIIATHSPFIYSKYSDREIVLESSRGMS